MSDQQRRPIPGGHSQKDGGFSLLEPTPAERDRTAGWVLACQQANEVWLKAADRLTRMYSLAAQYGANSPVHRGLLDAEGQYEIARAMALVAIEQATTFLPENRANAAGRH